MVKNLHPWFHGGAWSRPCLRWWVGSKALPFSRCVFLFAPELCGTPLSKTTPRSRPSSDDPGRGGPNHHDRRRRKTGCKSVRLASGNQRKQNADRRGSTCCTVRRSAHPAGRARLSAFHGGSALGT